MFASIFAVIAAASPAALFASTPVLLLARLRSQPWSWRRTAVLAAVASACLAVISFGAVAWIFAGGLRPADGLAVALAAAAEAVIVTALVAAGARLVASPQER